MKRLLTLFLFVVLACSCGSTSKLSLSRPFISQIKIMQTINNGLALANDSEYNVVAFLTANNVLYDDEKFTGTFVIVSTYSYVTVKEVRKTVPVYMKYSEYKQYVKEGKLEQLLYRWLD